MEDRRPETEDGRRKTEDGRQKTKDRRRSSTWLKIIRDEAFQRYIKQFFFKNWLCSGARHLKFSDLSSCYKYLGALHLNIPCCSISLTQNKVDEAFQRQSREIFVDTWWHVIYSVLKLGISPNLCE